MWWYWPGQPEGRWTAGPPRPFCAAPSPCPSPSGNWTVTAPPPPSSSWYWPRFSPVSLVSLSPFFHHQNPNIYNHKFIFSIPEVLEQKYKDLATKLNICTFDIKLPISNNSLNFVNKCSEWPYYIYYLLYKHYFPQCYREVILALKSFNTYHNLYNI